MRKPPRSQEPPPKRKKRYPKPFERKCRAGESRHQYELKSTEGNLYIFRCRLCHAPQVKIPQVIYG